MVLKMFWTQRAEYQLRDAFEYYKYTAGIRVAKRFVTDIRTKVCTLSENPFIGQNEFYCLIPKYKCPLFNSRTLQTTLYRCNGNTTNNYFICF